MTNKEFVQKIYPDAISCKLWPKGYYIKNIKIHWTETFCDRASVSWATATTLIKQSTLRIFES